MLTAVIFDCDGVLVDSETLAVQAGRQCLAEIGIHFEHDDYIARFCGRPSADILADLERESHAQRQQPLPADFALHLDEVERRAARKDLKAIAGAADFASQLGVPKAVASSSLIDSLADKLRLTGLHHLFEPHIFSTELVANGKPAPDLFLYAAHQINSPPAACVVVEDSVNGVRAGINAGMTVWGFIGGGHATPRLGELLRGAGASRVFSDFATMQQAFGDGPSTR